MKKWIAGLLSILLLLGNTGSVVASEGDGNYSVMPMATTGTVTYHSPSALQDSHGTKFSKYKVDGINAWCIEAKKTTPRTGYTVEITESTNDNLRKCLWYGCKGPGAILPDNNDGWMQTAQAASIAYCGETVNNTNYRGWYNQVVTYPSPPSGFKVYVASPTVSDSYQDLGYFVYEPNGTVQICKKSANPELTENNSCYSLSGAEYCIYSDEACTNTVMTLKTDANGNTSVNTIAAGNYWVKETVAPKGYALDTKKHPITVAAGSLTTLNVTDKPQLDPVGILLGKVDRETNANKPQGSASLQGAQYTVKYYDGLYDTDPAELGQSAVRTWVLETNEYGFCYLNEEFLVNGDELYMSEDGSPSLPIGTITIEETKAPEGYLVNPEIYVRQITTEGSGDLIDTYNQPVIPEEIMKGNISVIKHTDDGSTQIETPEEGAEFEVFLKSAGSYEDAVETERDILVCDKYGYAITKDLPFGIYTVKQTKGRVGKELMPAFDVFVSEDGEVYQYLINNATIVSDIEIVKRDTETGKVIPVSGAGFKVRNTDTGEYVIQHIKYPTPMDIDVYYTDSTGKLMLPEALPYGNYEIIEQSAPYGYVLDKTPVAFKVDGTTDVVIVEKYNTAQKGTITVKKTGEVFSSAVEENGIWKPVYEMKGLGGAVYEVVAVEDVATADGTVRYTKDQVVATVTTGKDGTATTEPLYLGTYQLRETKAPYGMVLNQEALEAKLTYAGQEVEITGASVSFINERQKAEISLTKTLEKDETFGIGMNGEIVNVQFDLFTAEDMNAADGTTIPKDALLETAYCNQDGKITFTVDIPVNAKVYVKEIATDRHYILSDTIYPVTFTYTDQDTEKVFLAVNEGNAIENKIIRSTIMGKKLDEDGFTICGALFGLFCENETEFTAEKAIMTCTSNEIGVFGFFDVPYGRWIVREIKAAPAFVLKENSYAVTVSEDEEIIEIVIENEFITGIVQTTKVDAEYPDKKLTGAVFEIYVDVDGNQDFNAEIDKLVGEMSEIETGIYQMKDLRYNGYFLHEKTAPEGFLRDAGYYYFSIVTDGETVAVENEAGIGFADQPIIGTLQITKKDAADGKLLSKAGFRIKDESGNVVAEGYTNENGVLEFILRYGKYTCEEFCAPDGYVLNTADHVFEITEDGQIIRVDMTNDLALTPKTGDEANAGFWLAMVIVLCMTIFILYGYLWLLPKYENMENKEQKDLQRNNKQNWRNRYEKKKRK